MFSVHTTPEEFENGGFTPKTHRMFSVHTRPEEFENATISGHFGLVFEEKSMIIANVFRPHGNDKLALKKVFEKLHFRDELVWTVGLTVEIKLRFQIPPA